MVTLVSMVGVASHGSNHLTAPVCNAPQQPPQLVPVQAGPLVPDSKGEFSQAGWSWLSPINSPLKRILGVLYHVPIWRTPRPIFSAGVLGLFVGCDDSGTMARGGVIDEDEVLGWVCLLEGQDDVMQNLCKSLRFTHTSFCV